MKWGVTLQITHENIGDRLILHYQGELDHHAARKAMDYAESLAALYAAECYELDLSGLTFMDSSGLAVALNLYRILQRGGRRMVISGCPAQPMRVFRAAGIPKIIPFEEEATC